MTAPLTTPDMDMRSLDGFVFNVARFLSSELLALTKECPEALRGAVCLWARSWIQIPPASLPNNDSIIAGFADMPIAKFRKYRTLAMRGFELCDDGRWYHRTLSEEANRVWPSILKTRKDRAADKERLKQWRERQRNGGRNVGETAYETEHETGTKRRTSPPTSEIEEKGTEEKGTNIPLANANGRPAEKPNGRAKGKTGDEELRKRCYDRGKEVFGSTSGGVITNLFKAKDDKPAKVLAMIEDAAEKRNPLEWINAWLWNHGPPGIEVGLLDSS